jgi:hypothetical protein
METFHKLFGSLLGFVYHCFDRIVIQGYLPLLTRPEHIVHFFRDVHGVSPLTKDVLAKRTQEYQQWVEAFARNHRIAIEWADDKALKAKGLKREDYVRPYGTSMERRKRFGPYFILKSLEQGPKFGVRVPKYPTDDPNYRIVARQRSRYTHYYFYIRDEVLGPLVMCVGSFLPRWTGQIPQFVDGPNPAFSGGDRDQSVLLRRLLRAQVGVQLRPPAPWSALEHMGVMQQAI